MNKPDSRKVFFALVVGIVFIAVTLTACAPASSLPEPISPAAEAPGDIQRVTLDESKTAFDNGEATFVDVRTASAYRAGHIPGALSIPLAELPTRIDELDPNQWIITYCT